MHKQCRSLNSAFDVYCVRLSTEYRCFFDKLSQHRPVVARSRSGPFAVAAKLCPSLSCFLYPLLDRCLYFLTSAFNHVCMYV